MWGKDGTCGDAREKMSSNSRPPRGPEPALEPDDLETPPPSACPPEPEYAFPTSACGVGTECTGTASARERRIARENLREDVAGILLGG